MSNRKPYHKSLLGWASLQRPPLRRERGSDDLYLDDVFATRGIPQDWELPAWPPRRVRVTVSERVWCVWRRDELCHAAHRVDCTGDVVMADCNARYCPWCGAPIKWGSTP